MSTRDDSPPAAPDFALGGELVVRRLGLGAMRIVGQPGNWGEPADRERSLAVLRAAVDAGVNLIDTAEAYGPGVSEELIAEALRPYPDDLVIATKGGMVKDGPGRVYRDGRPDALRRGAEGSLSRLGRDRLDLWQLHRIDPAVPVATSLEAAAAMREEGLIRHIGLSGVTADELRVAQAIVPIASVQNRFSLSEPEDGAMVDLCADLGIAYLPYGPLGGSVAVALADALGAVAARHGASPSQVALAWLLHRSPNLIPIPGTADPVHAAENAAADIPLSVEDNAALARAATKRAR